MPNTIPGLRTNDSLTTPVVVVVVVVVVAGVKLNACQHTQIQRKLKRANTRTGNTGARATPLPLYLSQDSDRGKKNITPEFMDHSAFYEQLRQHESHQRRRCGGLQTGVRPRPLHHQQRGWRRASSQKVQKQRPNLVGDGVHTFNSDIINIKHGACVVD